MEACMEASFVEALAAPEHSSLQELQAYWRAKKGHRIAPPRSAIEPNEIKALLPNILLIDVVGAPPRFRARLFGSKLIEAYGEEVTGRFGDEVDLDNVAPELMAFLESAARDCKPQFLRAEFTKQSGRHLKYEQIILPLSEDGKTVNMLLSAYNVEKAYG
jgi:hypothetical protein